MGDEAAEDRDEYIAENIFWVPPEARWQYLRNQTRQPNIGRLVDDAMIAIERDNPALKDVLPKDYARPALDKTRLGQVVDMVSNIMVGGAEARATDVLGNVYEYFLEQFALAEGRKGGEFYTPRSVVRLLVEMLEPYQGRVYDPCCGSSGMFVQSVDFIRAHASGNGNGGRARADISIYGQESNYTTWRMARMNLAIRGIVGRIEHGDSFHNDRHPDLRADYILANPPFNVSDWGGEQLRNDRRWEHTASPRPATPTSPGCSTSCTTSRRVAPQGFVLANGSMSSNQSGEGDDTQEHHRGRPGGLHHRTARPALPLHADTGLPLVPVEGKRLTGNRRDHQGETLFIDARKLGHMIDRTRRDLSQDDITRVAATYHAWRCLAPHSRESGNPEGQGEGYEDVPGFCKSATLDEIRKHGHVLTPGRYVGAAPQENDGEPFEEKMARLSAQWREHQAEAQRLDAEIEANLARLGFPQARVKRCSTQQ